MTDLLTYLLNDKIALLFIIQVAKQVRTVPVRGFGAEERFDAEECDLENCAFPHPTPILRKIVKGLNFNEQVTKNDLE